MILVVVVVNLVGTKLVGRAETAVIIAELLILVAFVALGLTKSDPARFEAAGRGWVGVLFAAGLLFVTYEAFGVVTNSAGEMANPAKSLPRTMYLALGIVTIVYVPVIVMTLTLPAIEANQGHVLSESGTAILGQVGFVVIGVAAVLAIASGVNATMFGDANLAYQVATTGEIPKAFARNVWRGGTGACSRRPGSPRCSWSSSRSARSGRWPAWRSC